MNTVETTQASFESILCPHTPHRSVCERQEAPDFFHDLNFDQIVAEILKNREEYNLAPFFYSPLQDLKVITYRQEVMRDLEHPPVLSLVKKFSEAMRTMRHHLKRSEKSYYKQERERWFLDAVVMYVSAVDELREGLGRVELASRGLTSIREYLTTYVDSTTFSTLDADATKLTADLAAVRYSVLIRGTAVTVGQYNGEPDYTVEIEQTFEKFRRGAVKDYRVRFPEVIGLNHVEAKVLERVAWLNPEVFGALEQFCADRAAYADSTIVRFDREIQFNVSFLAYLDRFRRAGLTFSYPDLSQTSKDIAVEDAFDLALAGRLLDQGIPIVRNGLSLSGHERILIVSGPNQGGKTTFARMVGQLHYLASLGCPVPGSNARLFLVDRLFTHFECEEDIKTLRGKLQDDLVRIHQILEQATPASLVIVNEMFSSTTLEDAVYLSRHIMAMLSRLDLLGVWVTFLAEIASFDRKTVSMVSTVDPCDPAIRTYKVERRPADGLAHALAIAEKHRVTHQWLRQRIRG